MKIVINKCYGGFGLSKLAIKNLIGKCTHVTLEDPKEYYGSDYPNKFNEDYKNGISDREYMYDLYEGKIPIDDHSYNNRTCSALVSVVEILGSEANGEYAELKVVEIPNGMKYEISDYDGIESIHEVHRVWG